MPHNVIWFCHHSTYSTAENFVRIVSFVCSRKTSNFLEICVNEDTCNMAKEVIVSISRKTWYLSAVLNGVVIFWRWWKCVCVCSQFYSYTYNTFIVYTALLYCLYCEYIVIIRFIIGNYWHTINSDWSMIVLWWHIILFGIVYSIYLAVLYYFSFKSRDKQWGSI